MTDPTPEQCRVAMREIIDDYRKATSAPTQERKRRVILIGHGWCAEIHRLAEAALTLIDNGHRHESLILVRTAWEMTISLHWLTQKGDKGAEGVFSEGARQSKALVGDMVKANFTTPQSVLDAVLQLPYDKTEEALTFKYFQQQCDVIDPSKQLYSVYRHLSGTAHPSDHAAYAFLNPFTDPPGLLKDPKEGLPVSEVTMTQCLIWAGRSFDSLISGQPRKQFLRRKARELGLVQVLPHVD
ncbi:DUF5677 domain-containing protein [Streptomyces virginiae]|uniref:DUF5677 domain-containing protein n=1 Tax=Streptomyces virginiae TaxID=1961 RepID=UPI002DD8AB6C|nr:DUF5677 domain-containing protein [Streptomyces virginiae]WSC76406.1 DUF5677 domain-containing protein [Streptomyces virginiae]